MKSTLKYIEDHETQFLAELETLCNQKSISETGEGMEEAADLVRTMLEDIGAHVEISRPESGYPILFGEIKGESPLTVLFYNHYDTLPAGDVSLWDSDPFVATIRDGKLFARGASDDKSDLLSRIHCIRAFQNTRGAPPVTIRFLIEGEEEIGSPNLSHVLTTSKGKITANLALWEGGTLDEAGRPSISLGTKGRLTIRLTARNQDRPLHTLYGALIENPAWRLVWALGSVKGPDERILIDNFDDGIEPLEPAAEDAVREIPFDEEATRKTFGISRFLLGASGEELKRRFILSPHCTIGALSGGMAGVIPEKAEAIVAFGLVPQQDPHDVYDKFRDHLDKAGFTDIETDLVAALPPSRTPLNAFPTEEARDALASAFERAPRIFPYQPGASPSHVIRNLSVPCASLGCISWTGSNFHGPNENIRIDDYMRGTKAIALFLNELSRKNMLQERSSTSKPN